MKSWIPEIIAHTLQLPSLPSFVINLRRPELTVETTNLNDPETQANPPLVTPGTPVTKRITANDGYFGPDDEEEARKRPHESPNPNTMFTNPNPRCRKACKTSPGKPQQEEATCKRQRAAESCQTSR